MKKHIFTNTFAIAHNTFRETIRDRILLSALLVIIATILFTLFIGSISLEQNVRVIVDFGLTAIYVLQMFVAIFIGSMLLNKEIERKTFFLIIPKPVRRFEILLGKTLGLTATTALVSLISAIALLVILYLEGNTSFIGSILLSILLSTGEAVILILISILFSSMFSPILAAISTITMYLIGHSGEAILTFMKSVNNDIGSYALQILYYLAPNLEKLNIRNDIVYGTIPNLHALLYTGIYFLAYSCFLFLITELLFRKKEF